MDVPNSLFNQAKLENDPCTASCITLIPIPDIPIPIKTEIGKTNQLLIGKIKSIIKGPKYSDIMANALKKIFQFPFCDN